MRRPRSKNARGALAACGAALVFAAGCDEPGLEATRGGLRHPERIELGRVPVGVGRTARFAIANIGDLSVSISDWLAEGDGVALVTVAPAEVGLPPGTSAEITVHYVPLRSSEAVDEVPLRFRTSLPGSEAERRLTVVAQAVRGGLEIAPSPVDFGRVLRGRTSTRSVTLTSVLTEAVAPTALIEPRTGDGRFEILEPASETGSPLRPGESLRVVLAYTPARRGPPRSERAALVTRFCDSPACETEVALIGHAIVDPLRCAPDPVDFGAVRPDRDRSSFTVCTNTSERRVRIREAVMALGSHPYLSTPLLDPVVLEPGGSETFEIRLAVPPDAALGALSGRLALQSEDAEDRAPFPRHEVDARAIVGAAALRVRPPAVDFGRVAVEQVGLAEVVLDNVGEGLLEVLGAETDAPFGVEPVGPMVRRVQLERGEAQALELSFAPTTAGAFGGVLRLLTDAPETALVEVPLGGVGLALEPCAFRAEPEVLDFGAGILFRSTTRGVQVRNMGDGPCLLREARLGPGSDDAFRLVEGGGEDVLLEPGEARTFVVAFRPAASAPRGGALDVKVSSAIQPTVTIPLRGSGRLGGLVLDPDEVDFGAVAPGCVGRQTLRVHNPTPFVLWIERVGLESEAPGPIPFELMGLPAALSGSGPGVPLAGGESLLLEVSYVPTASTAGLAEAVAKVVVEALRTDSVSAALYAKSDLDPFIEESWTQAGLGSVDILLVIDNSNSMREEQDALRSSFPRFLQYARDRGLDYRIAVVSTDVEGAGWCESAGSVAPAGAPRGACGFFSSGSSERSDPAWRVVEPAEAPSPEVAFGHIADIGLDGSPTEAGLKAATLALEPVRLLGWNTGFLRRADAFLGVVFLSDEDDQSPGPTELYEGVLASVKGARFRDRYALIGIVLDPDVCGAGGASGAVRYLDPIRRAGGTVGSICAASYDDVVDRIARAAAGLRERFVLRRPAFSPSVEVRVDRVPWSATSNGKRRWTYDIEDNAVAFEPASVPREGSSVEIRYRPRCFSR